MKAGAKPRCQPVRINCIPTISPWLLLRLQVTIDNLVSEEEDSSSSHFLVYPDGAIWHMTGSPAVTHGMRNMSLLYTILSFPESALL